MDNVLSWVMLILAITSSVFPLIVVFVLWRASRIFVSKEDWAEWKNNRIRSDENLKGELEKIDHQIEKLDNKFDNYIMNGLKTKNHG